MLVSGMAVGTPVIVQSNDTTHGVPQQPADPLSQSQGSVGGKRTKGKTSVSKVNQLDKMAAMDSVESVEQAKPPTPTTQAPATTPASQADDSGVHKRDCLVGDCSPGAQKSMAICRGKECQTNLLHTLGKERRHADGKSSHVTTETTQGTTSKTQVTVIAEKHSASDSANDIVCQLNNIPRVSDCVRNQHWKEIVKQPIECGAKKREWQCYCGFFDE
ncbi:hypothetical protein HDE_10202 [Halotydeus destructor]|nr:hypothetical protein HDE_10202 [Halotydeus destructor]